MKKLVSLLMVFLLLPLEVFASDPVDSTRLPPEGTWESYVGVVGGIPNSPSLTIFATIVPSDTLATINSTIASCPSNQVVFFQPMTNALNGAIAVAKDGVILLGSTNSSGVPITRFKNTQITFGPASGWDFSSSTAWTTNRVTAGATRGSAVMTLSSVTGLAAGRWVELFTLGSSTVTGGNWSDLFTVYPASFHNRVVSISGNDVTFERAFSPTNWPSIIGIAYKSAGNYNYRMGIENISLEPTDSSAGYGNNYISCQGIVECWLKNVYTYDLQSQNTHHVYVYGSYRFEIRHCDMSRMRTAEGAGDSSNNYCVLLAHSGASLIEDNVFHRVPNEIPMFQCSGGAIAYNFCYDIPYGNNNPSWLSQGMFTHGGHMLDMLFEGNWLPSSYNETSTSGSRFMVFLRNRMRGYDENPTQGVPKNADNACIVLGDGHNALTLVGNCMGDTNQHTTYRTSDTVAGGGSDTFPTVIIHSHTNTTNTLQRIGNYNIVSVGVPADEALTGGQVIVTSYLHSSKPAWFGDRPWPLVDPSDYVQSNQRTNWPGGIRYATGLDTPQGAGGGGGGSSAGSKSHLHNSDKVSTRGNARLIGL